MSVTSSVTGLNPNPRTVRVSLVSTQSGYSVPTVTVATSLPERGPGGAVLIVPVVSGADDNGSPAVVGSPFLDAEAIGEIEVALRALGAKGTFEQVTRLHVPSLPVASVLTVGLGAARDDAWPAEVILRGCIALFSRATIPGECLRVVGRHADAVFVKHA